MIRNAGLALVADRQGSFYVVDVYNNPPLLKTRIKLGKNTSIRGFYFDEEEGILFMSSFEDGMIYKYKMSKPYSAVIVFWIILG